MIVCLIDLVAPNNTGAIVSTTNTVNTNEVLDGKSAFKDSAAFYFLRFKNQ